MSYTTIKIEGRDIGLRFGYPCIRWFTEASIDNPDYFDKAESLTDIGVAKLLQFAYKNDCVVKEVKPEDIGYEKFYEWVEARVGGEGEVNSELGDIMKIFLESQPVLDQKKKLESEKKSPEIKAKKKKQTSTESKELSTVSSE
jgi:hypothetical protein